MGEGHSNVTGHGGRGPTGGVKGGPTGFGGGNPNSGKGWGVSQTPYGPLHNYNPGKFGNSHSSRGNRGGGHNAGHRGNSPNLSEKPELQVAIVPGIAVPLTLVASEWGFTLYNPKLVAAAMDAAFSRLAVVAMDAAPYVGRFAGIVGMMLVPSEIAKDDMSVTRRTVVTLPADRITTMPFAQLPTQPAVVANTRLHDMVQDGMQKIALVKSNNVPATVPVVQAKPTVRPGVFTAQILHGMPPIHIHVETQSPPPATLPAKGINEVKDAPVIAVSSPLGNHSHDAIVYFPPEAKTDPVYISVTTLLTPEQIRQQEDEDRRKQAAWEASYPIEAAENLLSIANDALRREQHNVYPFQAVLDEFKNSWEGQLLTDPEGHPFNEDFEEYYYLSMNYRYQFVYNIKVENRQDLDKLLTIGGEAFDPFPNGITQEDLDFFKDEHPALIMQALIIEEYNLLRQHLLAHQAKIHVAQTALNSAQHQLNMAQDEVNNAEQHLIQAKVQRVHAENARLAVEAAERRRIVEEQQAAEEVERQRIVHQNTFFLPAHPIRSRYSAGFSIADKGAITLASPAIQGLSTSLSAALAKFRTIAVSSLAVPIAAIIGAGFYPSNTGQSGAPSPLAGSIALSEMGLSATTPLPLEGEIDLPARMVMANTRNTTVFWAVKTGIAGITSKVKAGVAQFDRSTGVYTFTTDSLPPRTFTFTPVRPSGSEVRWVFPNPANVPVLPLNTGIDIEHVASPLVLPQPLLQEGHFHDYIIWFPADSGLQPVYIYLNSPRNEPGVVTGHGEPIFGNWLAEAGKGLGAPIPSQIADKLRGQEFSSFDKFRETFWREVSQDPELAGQFNKINRSIMRNGISPFPPKKEHVGGREKYEIHHVNPINGGGAVYDIDNLRVVTPKRHIEIHTRNGV
ncbi:colicin-like bacteriocin tRNase domain-containing protein [Yersinia alsatica]|uniref:S-type pyocin domain-containing protein n=1 Tax=Yersinia alsatica TaxID=2890317 RepID=A0ABY5UNP2_9GAMM|nr:colicin-like bacteriocin tRNase domain-containing protein [Yersinia alsatica]OWF68381.1 hypothetical protein B4901_13940 [Yersinia frederiksenii]UWM45096.1 S-type pyocin domain-containing protein [Yersinia alsatica]CNL51601.1 colicin/pyocin immunity family protein [Yersinia frederiksenii]CNL80931.1 colicin/pyocin immunity family protein [Yersinia frederiksenii]